MLVRFVAVAAMGWALADLALYWVVSQHNNAPMQLLPCVTKAIPLLIGLVMLFKARALAEWLADKMD